MIRATSVLSKYLVLLTVLACVSFTGAATAKSVDTYVDQAVPPDAPDYNSGKPLRAGDLTMDDLLKSLSATKNKKAALQKKTEKAEETTSLSSPQLKGAPKKESAASTMLLQGMQSALNKSGENATPLRAPLLPANRKHAPQTDILSAPQPLATAAKPETSKETTVTDANGCAQKTTTWSKTCAEVGYPDNYVGQIRGETRTSCPEGELQDVWVANGCVPPENAVTASNDIAPLTTPASDTPAQSEPSETSNLPDGMCGAANGLAVSVRPFNELCVSGKASPVTGEGPWRWNCQSTTGGITVSCAAPLIQASEKRNEFQMPAAPVAENAQCGSADNVIADHAPTSNLCAKGLASNVNGEGPWTWACSGLNGGKATACNAAKKTDGICGSSNGMGTDQMPMVDLCNAGYASAVTGNGPWAWTCSGINGGQASTCSASPRQNAICGPAAITGHNETPKTALCSVGVATSVNGSGPWTWTCEGTNGGASVACETRLSENGTCGSTNGTSVSETPSDNLCASGKPSRVAGNGPWNWSCAGSNGGNTASCTAVRATIHTPATTVATTTQQTSSTPAPAADDAPPVNAAPAASVDMNTLCGSASELVAMQAPSKNLCKSGQASKVNGNGPWSWTCAYEGEQSSCATLSLGTAADESSAPSVGPTKAAAKAAKQAAPTVAQVAECGSNSGQALTQTPSTELCTAGKASAVSGRGPWAWTCAKGKSRVSCSATRITNGTCGTANGGTLKNAPSSGLCSSGSPTPVEGPGPWMWSCVGSGGGSSTSCSATVEVQMPVDGECGPSADQVTNSTPHANLCNVGTASNVSGNGPWNWTCAGSNNGTPAFCKASKNTPPAPPPPGPAVNGLCGSSNGMAMTVQPSEGLCASGSGTPVSGYGPWNWNCLGENGGMTVSCTAPLQPPMPITGVCGAANGVPTLTKPRSGLCAGGITSAVSGNGPWTWSCSGVNGGSAVGCVAPQAGSNSGPLPSLTTPMLESATPEAAPSPPVTKKTLTTPRLQSSSLPPTQTGTMPPAPRTAPSSAPAEAPELPDDPQALTPPPIRDNTLPTPAIKGEDINPAVPGNRFVLKPDMSLIEFGRGSDGIDNKGVAILNNLVETLQMNPGVRITLTAYADNSSITPREARRLSLSRALAIRDFLTAKGVSSSRVDVRALGANVPSGEPDRVDIQAN